MTTSSASSCALGVLLLRGIAGCAASEGDRSTTECGEGEFRTIDGDCARDEDDRRDTSETGWWGTYDSDGWYDSGDYYYWGDPYIDTASWNCDADWYWYEVVTVGWSGYADLDIFETGSSNPWEEFHGLDQGDYDEGGAWDSFYIELVIVTDWEDQVSGVSTLFQCDVSIIENMTWAITVYGYVTGDVADCIAWGDDPDYYTDAWSYCSEADYR